MPDDQTAKLTDAVSQLSTIINELVVSAKAEHLNHLQKDDMLRRLSLIDSQVGAVKAGKLDDPSLS